METTSGCSKEKKIKWYVWYVCVCVCVGVCVCVCARAHHQVTKGKSMGATVVLGAARRTGLVCACVVDAVIEGSPLCSVVA